MYIVHYLHPISVLKLETVNTSVFHIMYLALISSFEPEYGRFFFRTHISFVIMSLLIVLTGW